MKKRYALISILAVVALLLPACNFPLLPVAETPSVPTPNMTMTALFAIPTATMLVITATPEATQTPQPTVTLTNTAVPPTVTSTATAVPILDRPSKAIIAYYGTVPINSDATWDEWKVPQNTASYIVYGKGNWSNAKDLSSSYKVAWDTTYLYLAFKVTDDVYVQNASGQEMFKGDSLELLVDSNLQGDFYTQSVNNDDYQFGFSGGKGGEGLYNLAGPSEVFEWLPRSVAGDKTSKVKQYFSRGLDADGNPAYRAEIAVPWSLMGIRPYSGMRLGFAVSVSDNDNTSSNVQESMSSSDPNRNLFDPTTWGELILQ
jgi:hypothetical protein